MTQEEAKVLVLRVKKARRDLEIAEKALLDAAPKTLHIGRGKFRRGKVTAHLEISYSTGGAATSQRTYLTLPQAVALGGAS